MNLSLAAFLLAYFGSVAPTMADGESPLSSCSSKEAIKVINEKFDGIDSGSLLFEGSPNVFEIDYCLALDYDMTDEEHHGKMSEMLFGEFCKTKADDGTCRAIEATYEAFAALEKMGCAPVFRNYLPSWKDKNQTSVACETDSFDIESKSFVKGKENGCNGFGLCSILTGVLQLSANQRDTGTCGPTSALMSISKANPVRALKLATQLMWAGQTEFLETPPCPYIYDMMPGLVVTNSLLVNNKTAPLNEFCGESPNTHCKELYEKFKTDVTFVQNPGLEFMATQSFGTSWFQKMTGGCDPEGFQMVYANQSNSDAVGNFQGSMPAAMMYWCNSMIEKETQECQLHINNNLKYVPSMTDSAWEYWISGNGMFWDSTSENEVDKFLQGNISFSKLPEKTQEYFEDLSCSVDPNQTMNTTKLTDYVIDLYETWEDVTLRPQISEQQLNEACKYTETDSGAVAMVIQDGVLAAQLNYTLGRGPEASVPEICKTGNEPYCNGQNTSDYPNCNHFVMLLKCDIPNNNYTIWTWSREYSLPKEVLVATNTTSGVGGSLCAIVTMGEKTDDYVPPKPTPCTNSVDMSIFTDDDSTGGSSGNSDSAGNAAGDLSGATDGSVEYARDADASGGLDNLEEEDGSMFQGDSFSVGSDAAIVSNSLWMVVVSAVAFFW